MERRFFIKGLTAAIGAAHLLRFSPSYAQVAAPISLVTPLRLNLSGAGRVGFYIDYSELDTVGTHTFYVCRTHGTTGSVSVTYSTGGDAHSQVSGSLSWGDGEADIKSFTVTVPSKSAGDHRMWALLSNPVGGAALHFGANHTRAYGVIDDGTISTDAVFYDSAATAGGNGTQASPYNSVHTAIANAGSKRYVYGKGNTVVDTTRPTGWGGYSGGYTLPVPQTRSGENTRCYVRNWPNSAWTISGSGTNKAGFYTRSGESYLTFRGINFSNLDMSGTKLNGFGIFFHYGNSSAINIELCSADNINSTTNTAAYMPWGVDGYKIWRCNGSNVSSGGSKTSENSAMFETYAGKNGSVQRCEATACGNMVYHKSVTEGANDVSTAVRFCIDATERGVHYGQTGGGTDAHSYTIVQGNLFKPVTSGYNRFAIYHWPGSDKAGNVSAGKHWWCNNIFDSKGAGDHSGLHFRMAFGAAIFNNIFYNSNRMWSDFTNTSSIASGVEYANHNLELNSGGSSAYMWKGSYYGNASTLNTANSSFASNDISGDPLFVDPSTDDFHLQASSPARNSGVSGADMGVYLTGAEIIGTNGGITGGGPIVVIPPAVVSPPAKTSLTVEILPSS